MTNTIRYTIQKADEGRYFPLSFPVPEGVERIGVRYAYPRVTAGRLNVVDLGLADPAGRVWGWSGSARREICAGEAGSTRGYLSGPIAPGAWQILVGAYKIPDGGLTVEYTVELAEKQPRLLFGDLHVHSDASDGKYDIPTLGRMARRLGLDFLSVTNHNNYAENLRLPQIDGLTLIPGTEWTHYKGHMNFFGVACPFGDSFIANSGEEMLRTVATAKALGAVVSVNHPKCTVCPYLWESDDCFDMMEVWNGPMRRVNRNGIAWWTGLLRAGRKLPAVGGSDFHRRCDAHRLGRPVTAVFSASRSAADILDAAARGRSFITCSVRGPRLFARCGEAGFGQTAAGADRKIEYRVENAGPFAALSFVTDAGEIPARGLQGTFDAGDARFVYLLLRRAFAGASLIRAVSNPIYFDREV